MRFATKYLSMFCILLLIGFMLWYSYLYSLMTPQNNYTVTIAGNHYGEYGLEVIEWITYIVLGIIAFFLLWKEPTDRPKR